MSEVRITDPTTGGQKGQKAERYDLLPFEALDEVARVYAYGAGKYAPHNWRKGYAWGLSFGALLRHVAQFVKGEDRDSESGCHHLAHAAFHCLTLITFGSLGLGTDDRAVRETPASAAAHVPPRIGIGSRVRLIETFPAYGGQAGTVVDESSETLHVWLDAEERALWVFDDAVVSL